MRTTILIAGLITALTASAQYQVPVTAASVTSTFTVERVDVRKVSYGISGGVFSATASFDWIGTNGVVVRSGDATYTQQELVGALGTNALAQCMALASVLPGTNVTGTIRIFGGQLIVTARFNDTDAQGARTMGSKVLTEAALRGYGVDPDQLRMWMRMLARVAVGQDPSDPPPPPAPEPEPTPDPTPDPTPEPQPEQP